MTGLIRDFEVKTALCEGHYKAMLEVINAKGLTQAGYIRHLILQDIYQSQDLVSQMSAIRGSTETDRKQP